MLCYLTSEDTVFEKKRLAPRPSVKEPEMKIVKAYPQILFQPIIGFGAALTEASGYVYSMMDEDSRNRFASLCFDEQYNAYSLCRLAIQSCDFSVASRSYVEDKRDAQLASFDIGDDRRYIIPLVKDALSHAPHMEFLASPWSPPDWAKTNRAMTLGGHLRASERERWAAMIAKFLVAYEAEGIRIGRITVQNEVNARQTWESCLYNAKQEQSFLTEYLKPALIDAGLDHVKVLVWDHNKEGMFDRASSFTANGADDAFDGVAFHWYSGDHFEAVQATRLLVGANRELIFSEGCDFFSDSDKWWERPHAEHYAHEIIGDVEAGANGFIDWNILLDSHGGPNHVGNYCDAPIMYDIESHTLNVRRPFYYLGHFSHFVKPGARRMLVTRYTTDIESCGFVNPDNQKVLVLLNRWDSDYSFYVNVDGGFFASHTQYAIDLPGHSIMTLVW